VRTLLTWTGNRRVAFISADVKVQRDIETLRAISHFIHMIYIEVACKYFTFVFTCIYRVDDVLLLMFSISPSGVSSESKKLSCETTHTHYYYSYFSEIYIHIEGVVEAF
jgi:hypothetical protein